jgi:hypothetical protein
MHTINSKGILYLKTDTVLLHYSCLLSQYTTISRHVNNNHCTDCILFVHRHTLYDDRAVGTDWWNSELHITLHKFMASSYDKLFAGFSRLARLQLSGRQYLVHHSRRTTATSIPIGTQRSE